MTDATGRSAGRTLLVGSGALGARLGRRILADGGEVTAIRRHADGLPEGFAVIEADLRRPLAAALPIVDSVVITLPPGDADAGDPLYPPALANLAAALPARPARVVFVSSTRVFEGRPGPTPLTEADDPAPASARAEALVEGERLAAELLGAVVVRPSGIYGPGRESLIRRVIAGAPVDRTRRTNRIHEDDLVRLLHVMLRAETPPALVHAVDEEPALMGDVVDHVAAALGVPAPPAVADGSGGGTVLDGRLMRELLGELVHPTFRSGYDAMVAARRHDRG